MAQIEIGTKSKSIQYLSVSKSASAHGEFCSTDDRWSNPILHKQSDYRVALSRFEVPLTRVPITAKMDNCIEIFQYKDQNIAAADEKFSEEFEAINGDNAQNLNFINNIEYLGIEHRHGDIKATTADANTFLDICESIDGLNMTQGKTIDMPACYTLYEFITKLNAQILEALLMSGARSITPKVRVAQNAVGTGLAGTDPNAYIQRGAPDYPNLFCQGVGAAGKPMNMTDPMANFKITVDSDSTFKVVMNQMFAQFYYIKFSQELFDMLQFREKFVADAEPYDRENLTGRRFMGDRFLHVRTGGGTLVYEMTNPTTRNPNYWPAVTMNEAQASTPPYTPFTRPVNVVEQIDQAKASPDDGGVSMFGPLQATTIQRLMGNTNFVADYQCTFAAANSAADSINRNKALIFSSSLATTSESVSGNTYRKIMTNFTIPIDNSFSWDPNTMQGGGISEQARATLIYTNANPSGGRWLTLSDPSPLYELKMDVTIKVWDFGTNTFKFEPVPLPEGSSFTCKLIFISNNDIWHDERPDKIHKT